jgi:hypoxanthine-guanine phosphoribosyltransferase
MFYCDVANSTAGDAALLITDVIDPGTTNGWVIAKFLSTGVARLISGAF